MSRAIQPSAALGLLLTIGTCAAAAERPAIAAHRYDEDWRPYCASVAEPSGADRLKCLSIAESIDLALGGEWRERLEAVDAPDFGIGAGRDHYALHRALLHGDLRYADRMRLFVQLGSLHQTGRSGGPEPTDEDDADVQQAFLDLSAGLEGGRGLLRIGRQEFTLGSSRLVSARESPNARRAFDGIRLQWSTGTRTADAFYLQPVTIEADAFDNPSLRSEQLWGAQWAATGSTPTDFELYYLGYQRDQRRYAQSSAEERRHSVGTRLFGHRASLDWNYELVAQFGTWGTQDIRAWTIASDTGYRLSSLRGRPRLSLKVNVASGDADPHADRLQTFNALYPNPTYFSEASLIAPANIIDIQPAGSVDVNAKLKLMIGWDLLWKQRRDDAVYTPPGAPLPASEDGSREIGNQVHLGLIYTPARAWQLRTTWVHFDAGHAVRQAGGHDVDYWMGSAAYRF